MTSHWSARRDGPQLASEETGPVHQMRLDRLADRTHQALPEVRSLPARAGQHLNPPMRECANHLRPRQMHSATMKQTSAIDHRMTSAFKACLRPSYHTASL